MRIILRQLILHLIFTLLVVIATLVITFIAFPIEDYKDIVDTYLFNVHFLYIIGSLVLVSGIFQGLFSSQLWRQHLRYIERQLRQVYEGRDLIEENYKDLKGVDGQIERLQQKITQQIEIAQQLAAEQANKQEESLQEVILEERNRLARDLHDAVSQQLFAASMMMSAITESDLTKKPDLQHQLTMVENMIQQSQLEMRALLLHLRPVQLKGKLLQEGIKDLVKELMAHLPIKVTYQLESFTIDKGIENQLFRIAQEAISNTLRHAEATNVKITLMKRDAFIIMRIMDDGKGFDIKMASTSSYGLDTMKERSEELGGTFKIVSLPNKGTRVEVKIPTI